MEREYFIKTERIGFSKWKKGDLDLAETLWGNQAVTKYLCATGKFSHEAIEKRLETEISNGEKYGVQYWPFYSLESGALIGCCGLRPHGEDEYEIGFHLRPEFWGQGYAKESAKSIIEYAFDSLHTKSLFAGHNPNNVASKKLLLNLGFTYLNDEFYAPTGLFHPSYGMNNAKYEK